MCGIAGLIDTSRIGDGAGLRRAAAAMGDTLVHRGPDSGGVHVDADAGLALAHRRLAIVDLSPAGAQPMQSHCGRYVIVFNGEVYNSEDLRRELPGMTWRGHSDTETMLEACARWGAVAAAQRFIGMFAFALWDRSQRTLSLVRDRLGIKPLYWMHASGKFAFASELKALHALPGFAPQIDRAALSAFLRYGCVPAPATIYAGVAQLEPGKVLELRERGEPAQHAFWSLQDVVANARRSASPRSDAEATDALELLLRDCVKRRMIADVPLGAFLSGGIDSSLVTALMQVQSSARIKTFSIGFAEKSYDEAPHAKAVAHHLGTDHTELYVDEADALAVVPRLPDMFDEPFGDASQIPTYLVSQLARRHVTVALSGDGGDELFAGYSRYALAGRLRSILAAPFAVRRMLAGSIRSVPPAMLDRAASVLPVSRRPNMFGDRAHKFADLLMLPDIDAVYRRLVSYWDEPLALTHAVREAPPRHAGADGAALTDPVERMQYADILTYLPDDILTKVDRASMAVALEARVPLLDHRVVEFAWSLPMRQKLAGGTTTKWLMREVLARHVPRPLFERPKAGFALPIEHWLRGKLKDWAEDLLDERRMRAVGLIDPEPVQKAWREHQSGTRNRQYRLWAVLMFEAWRRRWAA